MQPGNRQQLACMLGLCIILPATSFAVSCSVSTTSLAFGSYDVFSTSDTDTTATIQVKCTPGNSSYKIALEAGLFGSINSRAMQGSSGQQKLRYNLYTDANYSNIWGNGSGNTSTVSGTTNKSYTVYGKIPQGQNVSVGNYNDSVSVTVSF